MVHADRFIPRFVKPKGLPVLPQNDDMNVLLVQVSKFQHSQTKSTGRERPATPFHRDRQGLPRTLRDHVRSSSALSAFKKRLAANLSAKLQLSVAKLSTKGIFSLAKRDFLVANGRMAADFSSPGQLCVPGAIAPASCMHRRRHGPEPNLENVAV